MDVHDKSKVRHITPMVDIAIIQTITTILDHLLIEYKEKLDKITNEEDLKLIYEAFFIFAGLWAIGGPVGGG